MYAWELATFKIGIKTLICKIFLWKCMREVTSIRIFDCCDNYSGIQQNFTYKAKSAQKCMRSSRDCICSKVYLTNHLLKRKTDISIIIRRMTTEESARVVGMLQHGACIRQVSHFSWECLKIPVSCWQMSHFALNHTELVILRSPGILDAGISYRGPMQTSIVSDTYTCTLL